MAGSGPLFYANAKIWDTAARTRWTGSFPPGEAPTVIIVLGMGITPTNAIDDRADLAAEVWKASFAQTIIASGGQGKDDLESEAQSLRHHLVAMGVPDQVIVDEDHSTSTFENLTFSTAILKTRGLAGAKVAVVTHDYHALRAEEIARSLGLRASVVSTPGFRLVSTPGFRLASRSFAYSRELLAFWKWRILGW